MAPFVLFFLLLLPSLTHAECTGASPVWSCTPDYASLDALINDSRPGKVRDGDTINVRAGNVTYTSLLTIMDRSFSLIGAGEGNTIITGMAAGKTCAIQWVTKSTGGLPAGFVRISGFTFRNGVGCGDGSDQSATVELLGVSHQVRFDHNRCEGIQAGCLHVHQDVRGVADHNAFENLSANLAHMVPLEHENWNGSGGYADSSWASDPSTGTIDVFVFEDNLFSNRIALPNAGYYMTNDFIGARSVYRFNIWKEAAYQTHGTESGGRWRGFRHTEVYRNKFTWSLFAFPDQIALRGGTGFVFDNQATTSGVGTLSRIVGFNSYRRNPAHPSYWPWGYCGQRSVTITRSGRTATATSSSPHGFQSNTPPSQTGWVNIVGTADANLQGMGIPIVPTSPTTFTYAVANTGATSDEGMMMSAFDGNTEPTGYPCMDQLGRGKSVFLSGDGPGYGGVNPARWAGNALEPLYAFNNILNGTLSAGAGVSDVIRENRDVFNQNPAYNGTTQRGVGRGPRASRPVACTVNDGWWATDDSTNWNTSTTETYSSSPGLDGVLDICTATGNPGTWQNAKYVPFMYPHPLVSGAGK